MTAEEMENSHIPASYAPFILLYTFYNDTRS